MTEINARVAQAIIADANLVQARRAVRVRARSTSSGAPTLTTPHGADWTRTSCTRRTCASSPAWKSGTRDFSGVPYGPCHPARPDPARSRVHPGPRPPRPNPATAGEDARTGSGSSRTSTGSEEASERAHHRQPLRRHRRLRPRPRTGRYAQRVAVRDRPVLPSEFLRSTGLTCFACRISGTSEPEPSRTSTSSAAASPAKTSPTPAREPGSTANARVFGRSTPESFASFDPATSSWRTSQLSLLEDSGEFSETWPRRV
jgi:hypothetical protein